jgi:head-tail adaptor
VTAIGPKRNLVALEAPGDPPNVPDGFGGYVENWQPLEPATWYCAIEPADQRTLEQLGAGAILAQATNVVSGRYFPAITTKTRIQHKGRTLNVIKVTHQDWLDETHLVCAEVVE